MYKSRISIIICLEDATITCAKFSINEKRVAHISLFSRANAIFETTSMRGCIMINLLDSNALRINKIITILSTDTQWHHTKDLADDLNVSLRTIATDIKVIKQRWNHLLEIESSLIYGIRVLNRSESVRREIIHELILESNAALVLKLIFLKPQHNLDYYAENLFISKSTISRTIPKINTFLKKL